MQIKYKSDSFELDYTDTNDRDTRAGTEECDKRCQHLMKLIDSDVQSTLKHSELSRIIREKESQNHPFLKKE